MARIGHDRDDASRAEHLSAGHQGLPGGLRRRYERVIAARQVPQVEHDRPHPSTLRFVEFVEKRLVSSVDQPYGRGRDFFPEAPARLIQGVLLHIKPHNLPGRTDRAGEKGRIVAISDRRIHRGLAFIEGSPSKGVRKLQDRGNHHVGSANDLQQ